MPPRTSWKGFIRLSLVSVPVKAYTAAASGGGEIHLNQLHQPCHNRIQYRKTCPVHGEIPAEEIVKGYEFSQGQYAVIDLDELDKLRGESDKSIHVDKFIDPSAVDPNYFSGKAYFLAPDGPVGQKPYALLRRAMAEQGVWCLARIVLFGREQLVLLRPLEGLIVMQVLHYASQLKMPVTFQDDVADGEFTAAELKLTKTLVAATTDRQVNLGEYEDLYVKRLGRLVQAKVKGEEIVSAPQQAAPPMVDLMEALKASVARAQQNGAGRPATAARKTLAGKLARGGRRTTKKRSKAG